MVAIGGSDAGIQAALRARELDPSAEVTVVLADAYPNYSICGIPYYVSGDVADWHNLAHRTIAELEATGMTLRLDTVARQIDPEGHRVTLGAGDDDVGFLEYDALVVATGALPVTPPIAGLDHLGPREGVHLLHSMGDTFALMRTLEEQDIRRAVIVGAGYVGLEMAEALVARGVAVTQVEQLPEVLPTVDPELGALVRAELQRHGGRRVMRHPRRRDPTTGTGIRPTASRSAPADPTAIRCGSRPTSCSCRSGYAQTASSPPTPAPSSEPEGAIVVDRQMRTNLPDVLAAGDCVITHHRLLGISYLPLGTTAHKQGRIAGENALGGSREFAGSLGTQVVKVFDLVAARTGLRDHEAAAAGFDPVTVPAEADDHKAYYPGSHKIAMRYTGDRRTGQLLGVQLVGHLQLRDRQANRHPRDRHLQPR